MNVLSKKQLVLENLHCANCASKIENKIKELDDIKDVTVNFMTRSLLFETKDEDSNEDTLLKIKKIVNKIEPHVIIKEDKKTIPLKPALNAKKIEIIKAENNSCCSRDNHEHNHKEDCCSGHDHGSNCCGGHDHNHDIINKIQPKEIKNNKKELILEGLDCANCASKIENKTREIKGVKAANLNFMNKTLVFQYDEEENIPIISEEIKSIVKKLEPQVKVLDKETIEKNNSGLKKEKSSIYKEHKKEINKLILGGTIFLIGNILNLENNIELIIFLIAYVIVGGEIVLRAVKNIARGQIFDENFLMTIATIGAFIVGQYPEGVGVMLFYQVGELFQHIAVNNSRKSISSLMDIRPDFANLKKGNDIVVVSPEEVNIGEYIVVKPGEKVPLDGVVVDGTTMVDTSALTGESMPRTIEKEDEVLSGFINQSGVITVKVTKPFGESTVAKILDLVQNAGNRKAKAENFITKFAKYYTPIVVISAALLAIIPPLFVEGATFSDWGYRALIFLVISCPCALVISIPLGFFGGIGAASKNGVLIKGSNYLEILKDIETVVFDKTGTLTKGVFNVTTVNSSNNYDKEKVLEYAAYAESFSNHPIAKSVVNAYKKDIDNSKIEKHEEIAGQGIIAYVEGKKIVAGNIKIMESNNIEFSKVDTVGTVIYVAIDKEFIGSIIIEDTVKDDAKQAIAKLKSNGVKNTVMLTGDNEKVALKVGKTLGLDKVYYELLPQDKVEKLEEVDKAKSKNKKVAFVGDGINDAPVLARADIGIAMGGLGSDAAIEAADVVIMTDEPSKIATAINISKKTRKIVVENIVFALGVKIIVLILGSLRMATMWDAVFADVGVAVLAILNAMRVIRYKKY
nr:heavy metal translocating P-type ATPase [Clostridium sp. ATCC 25772]